jgi:hypothetical protein
MRNSSRLPPSRAAVHLLRISTRKRHDQYDFVAREAYCGPIRSHDRYD